MSTITLVIVWSDLNLKASNGSIITIPVQLELITLTLCKLHCLINIVNQEICDVCIVKILYEFLLKIKNRVFKFKY